MNKKLNYLVITHNRVYGIPDALRDYLNKHKADSVAFLANPLDHTSGDSFLQIHNKGKINQEIRMRRNPKFGFINFIIDVLITIFWVLSKLPHMNVVVANDSLNTLSALVLRRLGKVDKVIYYSIDFSLNRLNNRFLNIIYHRIEAIGIKYSDELWVVSEGIVLAREKYLGIDKNKYHQKLVPTGVWIDKRTVKRFSGIRKTQLFFVGHVLEKQGLQMVFQAIPEIVKHIKNFSFLIVGDGDYKDELIVLAKKLEIEKHLHFTGIVKSQKKLFELMSQSSVGVATYKPTRRKTENFTYFADPGKIKDYLSMGLPIVMTDVSHNAKTFEKLRCAIVVGYSSKEISKAIIKLMSDESRLLAYRKQALKVSQKFDWNKIFTEALS